MIDPHPLAPHHDGSSRYVDDPAPDLGDVVTVRLHAPAGSGVGRVAVRSVVDGEPAWAVARPRADGADTWWQARIRAATPDTRYRFLLDGGPHGYRWQTAAGIVHHDPTDAADHRLTTHPRPPTWARRAVVYQVVPDRFARSDRVHPRPPWADPAAWDDPVIGHGPGAMTQWYGGDLDGVADHLDHVAALGASAIWLTPVWPAGSNHRYDATTFARVDPALGGDAALARLAAAARDRGIRLVGDLTANHTGVEHEWFRRARTDRAAVEAGFYEFTDWPDRYRSWLDTPSLPTLDHRDPELARRLFHGPDAVARRWIGPHAFAGWRVDVANMTGRSGAVDRAHEVARAMRAATTTADPEALVVAEHGHDASADLAGDGWHATMNYAGFTNPVWTWLRAHRPHHDPRRDGPAEFMGRPTPVPRLPGTVVARAMRAVVAGTPWPATTAAWNLLGSHDTARIRTVVGDEAAQRVALGLLAAWPGAPTVFAGDEWGLEAGYGELARTPMPWDGVDDRRRALARHHGRVLALRRDLPALVDGGLRWLAATDDALAVLREHPEQDVLVVAVRRGDLHLHLPWPDRPGERVLGDLQARPAPGRGILVTGHGPAISWWAHPH